MNFKKVLCHTQQIEPGVKYVNYCPDETNYILPKECDELETFCVIGHKGKVKITQNESQYIKAAGMYTTPGEQGRIEFDSQTILEFLCVEKNKVFKIISMFYDIDIY